jgi:SAM-dependent methyltransferase
MNQFLKGSSSLKPIELGLLGQISGKSILHLQCHFGQDTISLSRMGAKVTGIDLSDVSIEKAEQLNKDLGTDVEFICCNIYDLPKHLDKKYDIVFTSYGVIGWLPDLSEWAKLISSYLKPKGEFVFVEFHPVVWMFDDDFKNVGYNYFNEGPLVESESGTYADRKADIQQTSINWNHSISEVLSSLIRAGLEIQRMEEFDYSPYNCFLHTIEFEPGKFRIEHLGNKIPMVYSLVAKKIKES